MWRISDSDYYQYHLVRTTFVVTYRQTSRMKIDSSNNKSFGRSPKKPGITSSKFPKNISVSDRMVFHPQDECLIRWNKLFVISCMIGVYLDPFLFYFLQCDFTTVCLDVHWDVAGLSTALRTLVDVFYAIHMVFEFRTAYTEKVWGKTKAVTDQSRIAAQYIRGQFLVDLLSVMPFPQIVIWMCMYKSRALPYAMKALIPIVCLQYIPRFLRVYPLTIELQKTSSAFPSSSLAGAVYYLLWFLLVSYFFGASWYLLAVERNFICWNKACNSSKMCDAKQLYCRNRVRGSLFSMKIIELTEICSIDSEKAPVTFGIYKEALSHNLFRTRSSLNQHLYSFWWGLKNLSTLGQGLQTGIYAGEIVFSLSISLSGVIHYAVLIGNMHSYLKSFTTRLEELRMKKREMDQWMHRRLIPQDLRQRVGRYNQYRWWETGGMDEETFLQSLPKDIRRDVKRHLCMDMIRKVPIFGQMDDQFLDAFCERLKSSLYTEGAYIVQDGDPVNEMVFITHGVLESVSIDGASSKFINQSILKEGDFCGEELLPWALDPQTGSILPTSTRMVQALTEVEAFTTTPEDLRFLARQFKCLHTQQAKHLFRFYSQHWRTWAACCIQRAWRRYSERKRVLNCHRESCSPSLTSTVYAFRFIHALRGGKLEKPREPDFSSETD